MKKVLLMAAVVSTLVACNQSGYTISGDVQGFEEGTKVYLSKIEGEELVKIDSTEIKGTSFEFKGEVAEIDYSFVQIGDESKQEPFTIPMILENGKIKVTADKADMTKSKVTGSKNNDDLAKFNDIAYPISKQIQDFQVANNEKFQAAAAAGDMATVQSMMAEVQGLQQKLADEGIKFVDANKDSYVSLLLLTQFGSQLPIEDIKTKFESLSEEVRNTKVGKDVLSRINEQSKMSTQAPVQQEVPTEETPAAEAPAN